MRIWGFKEYIAFKTGNAKGKTYHKIVSIILIIFYILLIALIPFVMMYLSSELKVSTAGAIGVGLMMIIAVFFLWRLFVRVNMSRFDVFIKVDIGLFRVILGSYNSLKLKNPHLVDNQLHLIETLFGRALESGGEIDITKTRSVSILKIVGVRNITKRRHSYLINCTALSKGTQRTKGLRVKYLEGIDSLIDEFELVKHNSV